MNVTVYVPDIPKEYRNNKSKGKAIKQMALDAIKEGLPPSLLPSAGLNRFSIAFNEEESLLLELAKQCCCTDHGIDYPIGKVIGAFCYTKLLEFKKAERKTNEESDFQNRPDQKKYYTQIASHLKKKNIVLAEGGTGLGKSRVLATLARDQVAKGVRPVCIAAPTIAVMRHIYNEIEEVPDTDSLNIAIIFGKSQFIVPENLKEVLDDPDISKTISGQDNLRKWLGAGCPPLPDSSDLEVTCPGIRYLAEDMYSISPETASIPGLTLSPSTVKNAEDNEYSPALEVYEEMFKNAIDADIIICSHAMIAIDMHLRNFESNINLLPIPKALFIDEAHSFEMSVSSINSSDISILTILSYLRKTKLGNQKNRKYAINICKDIMDKVKNNKALNEVFIKPNDWKNDEVKREEAAAFQVLNKLEQLQKYLKALFPGGAYYTYNAKSIIDKQIQDATITLARISSHKNPVKFTISPVRNFPSFTVGPGIGVIKHLFKNLWNRTKQAVLVSATLTLPDSFGHPSASHIRKILNIPNERLVLTQPIQQKWLYKPIKLHTPPLLEMDSFVPAIITSEEIDSKRNKDKNQEKFERWLDTIANFIESTIINKSIGGTLVLATSYVLLEKMNMKYHNSPYKLRMIFQDRHIPFSAQLKEFIDRSHAGDRPVWFALGNAWTGINISGQHLCIPADQDNILTDLVIPRVPFGMNSTMTGLYRNSRRKMQNGEYTPLPTSGRNDAAFLFKQGIGRLIRREGVPDKNLWILDGRIWKKSKKFYGVFQRILENYQ